MQLCAPNLGLTYAEERLSEACLVHSASDLHGEAKKLYKLLIHHFLIEFFLDSSDWAAIFVRFLR